MNKYYRVKTEKEFIEDFGEDWRDVLICKWVSPQMDVLFGKEIPEEKIKSLKMYDYICFKGWTLDADYITSSDNIISLLSEKDKITNHAVAEALFLIGKKLGLSKTEVCDVLVNMLKRIDKV